MNIQTFIIYYYTQGIMNNQTNMNENRNNSGEAKNHIGSDGMLCFEFTSANLDEKLAQLFPGAQMPTCRKCGAIMVNDRRTHCWCSDTEEDDDESSAAEKDPKNKKDSVPVNKDSEAK